MGAGAVGVATKLHKICVKLYDNDLGAREGGKGEEVEQLMASGKEKAARTRKWRANFAHSQQLQTHTHTHSYERHTPAILIFFVCSSRS